MTKKATPIAPSRALPEPGDDHYQLYKDVREAISSLPIYFRTETHISGIMAADIPSPKAQSALTIIAELERLLDITE
jgi:hypothetical protein